MRNRLRRIGLAGTVFILLLGGTTAVGAAAHAAPAPAATSSSASAGLAPRVETRSAASATVGSARARGTRRAPTDSAAPRTVTAAPVAGAAGPGIGSLLRNVDGVGSRDSAVTNFGLQFEPPDQGLCVGNGFVLEAVNSAYSVYNTAGVLKAGPFNVNDLFNEGASEFTSDPRCYYDAATNTWFATILFINDAFDASRIDLAVNTSGDPRTPWAHYRIDTTDDGRQGEPSNAGCPCLGDQPTLGIDPYNVYVTTNEFSLAGPQYNGAQVYAVARTDLAAGNPSAHVAHLGDLAAGGAVASSLQPALTTGSAPAEYLLSSLDPHGTFDSRLGVWALTHRASVATGGVPLLSRQVITSEAYGVPPKADQKGSSSQLDAGDDRMQQTQFVAGTLWGSLTTALTIPGDPSERAGAAWFAVTPTMAGDRIGSAVVKAQGYVGQRGDSVLYPAVQVDPAGNAAMVFTLTGSDRYPAAAYATLRSGAAAFGAPRVAAAGSGPYDPTATRWGDYSFAVLDPTADAVWAATEYIPPVASQTRDGRRNWGTRFLEISLS